MRSLFSKKIAIMYDGGSIFKYGHPDEVIPIYRELKEAYEKTGRKHNLGVIVGRFPKSELKKILTIDGYIKTFIEKESKNT